MTRNPAKKSRSLSGQGRLESRYEGVADELLGLYIHQSCLNNPICLKRILEKIEREIIFQILEKTNGNQRDAARFLRIKPTTLHYKLRRMGITAVHRYVKDASAELEKAPPSIASSVRSLPRREPGNASSEESNSV